MSEAGTFDSSTDTRLTALVGSTSKITPSGGLQWVLASSLLNFCLKHFR